MTCNDCVHNEICQKFGGPFNISDADTSCTNFKSRSRFVELPCVAGEYVYVIEPIFGESIEHTIRRRKIKSIEPHAEIKFYGCWIHDFLPGLRRYFFSTYEEAEQALKERENGA